MRVATLSHVMADVERIEMSITACAQALSSINLSISLQEAAIGLPLAQCTHGDGERVEKALRAVSEELAIVKHALRRELRGRVLVDHQLAAAVEQEEGGRYAAFHDLLTGLPNRALFNDRMEHSFAQAQRHEWALGVMFVDLDAFKAINDTHGHEAGDRVLQTIATRLELNARGEDTVSRYGGDEFICLLPAVRDDAAIAMIASKMLASLSAPVDVTVAGIDLSLSVQASIGISMFPRDGATVEELVNHADEAMYRAKQTGCGYSFIR